MPTSTTMYSVQDGLDFTTLEERLEEAELERQVAELSDPIRTEFSQIEDTTNGTAATIVFELPEKYSGWDGVEHKAVRNQAKIRFTDSFENGGVLVIGKSDLHPKIESRLLDFFEIGPDELEQVEISTDDLESVMSDDSLVESKASYKSVDENTSSASLSGALGESTPASRFNENGDKIWAIYESEAFEKKIGITVENNAVVFWGNLDDSEMERYWTRIVLPNIN